MALIKGGYLFLATATVTTFRLVFLWSPDQTSFFFLTNLHDGIYMITDLDINCSASYEKTA